MFSRFGGRYRCKQVAFLSNRKVAQSVELARYGKTANICAGQALGTIGDEIADQAPVPRELFAATRNT